MEFMAESHSMEGIESSSSSSSSSIVSLSSLTNIDFSSMELLSQGAEGKLYRYQYHNRPSIMKIRVSKSYRVPFLDKKLNKQRLLQETRCMAKCNKAGIRTPTLYLVDQCQHVMIMEQIMGKTLKDILREHASTGYQGICLELAKTVGIMLGKMHEIDVVHGDLTTSNIMIRDCDHQAVLIDFGLGQMQAVIEDKAVDLYVLERALISTHPGSDHLIPLILDAYRFACRKGTLVLGKLDQVRMRGRKRDMLG